MGKCKSGEWLEGEGEEVRGGEKAMIAGGGGASTGAEIRAKPLQRWSWRG